MSDICERLHRLVNGLPVYRYPFNEDLIPRSGLYLMFEEGEWAHGTSRIVRVGTHTGEGMLRSRLLEHFVNRNKDRSIFRKNVGRALLARDGDPLLQEWNSDRTGRQSRVSPLSQDVVAGIERTEDRVTEYIRGHIRFVVIALGGRSTRLRLEAALIATVAQCQMCRPSADWLGRYSPLVRVRESGLWQVQHLDDSPLIAAEYEKLEELITAGLDTGTGAG